MIQYRTTAKRLYDALSDVLATETCDLSQDRIHIQQAVVALEEYENMQRSSKKPSEKYDKSWLDFLPKNEKSDFVAFISTETEDEQVGHSLRKVMQLMNGASVKISESYQRRIWIEGSADPETIRLMLEIPGIDAITGRMTTEIGD